MKPISAKKTIFLIITIWLLASILTIGPDIYKANSTPPNKRFTGQASWFDPWDMNIYFSAIGWGKRGGLLFENLYDTNAVQALPVRSARL